MLIVALNHQQPNHICYHTCALFSDLLWHPRNIRRTASLASPALCGLALLPACILLTWNGSGTDPALKLFLIDRGHCRRWACQPVTTGPRAAGTHWPHLDFTNLISQVRQLKEPCFHLKFDPHKNSDQIIN